MRTPSENKSVLPGENKGAGPMRVIAVDSFTDDSGEFHPYGHEFSMADSPERERLLKAGTIREDDRRAKSSLPQPTPPSGA